MQLLVSCALTKVLRSDAEDRISSNVNEFANISGTSYLADSRVASVVQ